MEYNSIVIIYPIKSKLEIFWEVLKVLKFLKQSSGTTPTSLFFIHPFLDRRNPLIFWKRYPFCYHSCILERDSLYQSIQVWRLIGLEIYGFVRAWKHMDNANVIHRVLENKPSLLQLHSADGAPFYFTYMKYVFEKMQVSNNAASR